MSAYVHYRCGKGHDERGCGGENLKFYNCMGSGGIGRNHEAKDKSGSVNRRRVQLLKEEEDKKRKSRETYSMECFFVECSLVFFYNVGILLLLNCK